MEAHEYPMSDAVTSRETDVMGMYYAADGKGRPTNADELGIGVDDMEESAREAIGNYALSVESRVVLRVVLGIGGPTQYMEAPISRGAHGWERDRAVTFVDSWACPDETVLNEESYLTRFFDEHVEFYSPEND